MKKCKLVRLCLRDEPEAQRGVAEIELHLAGDSLCKRHISVGASPIYAFLKVGNIKRPLGDVF